VFSHLTTLALGKLHSNPRFPQYRKPLQLRGILHLTDYSTASSCALATRNTSTRNTLYKNKPADRVLCRRNSTAAAVFCRYKQLVSSRAHFAYILATRCTSRRNRYMQIIESSLPTSLKCSAATFVFIALC